jgi:transcriptional regulator with XRE-family HTH domain
MAGPAVVTGPGGRQRRSRPLLRAVLGHILRRIRHQQGRTLADVARVSRISVQYLSELERGRKEASSEVLAAICDALRVELADVLAEAGRQLLGGARRQLADPAERQLADEAARQPAGQAADEIVVIRLGTIDGGLPPAVPPEPGTAQCLLAA